MPRACVIVLDAVGAGELPDAAEWGDEGSDTLGNVARAVGGLDLPNLEALGLGNIEPPTQVTHCSECGRNNHQDSQGLAVREAARNKIVMDVMAIRDEWAFACEHPPKHE